MIELGIYKVAASFISQHLIARLRPHTCHQRRLSLAGHLLHLFLVFNALFCCGLSGRWLNDSVALGATSKTRE